MSTMLNFMDKIKIDKEQWLEDRVVKYKTMLMQYINAGGAKREFDVAVESSTSDAVKLIHEKFSREWQEQHPELYDQTNINHPDYMRMVVHQMD